MVLPYHATSATLPTSSECWLEAGNRKRNYVLLAGMKTGGNVGYSDDCYPPCLETRYVVLLNRSVVLGVCCWCSRVGRVAATRLCTVLYCTAFPSMLLPRVLVAFATGMEYFELCSPLWENSLRVVCACRIGIRDLRRWLLVCDCVGGRGDSSGPFFTFCFEARFGFFGLSRCVNIPHTPTIDFTHYFQPARQNFTQFTSETQNLFTTTPLFTYLPSSTTSDIVTQHTTQTRGLRIYTLFDTTLRAA